MTDEELKQYARGLNNDLLSLVKKLEYVNKQKDVLTAEIREKWGALKEVRKLAGLDIETGRPLEDTAREQQKNVPEVIKNLENVEIKPSE